MLKIWQNPKRFKFLRMSGTKTKISITFECLSWTSKVHYTLLIVYVQGFNKKVQQQLHEREAIGY